MEKIKYDDMEIFISDDVLEEDIELCKQTGDALNEVLQSKFIRLIWGPLSEDLTDYLNARKSLSANQKFAILHAHGSEEHDASLKERRGWFYRDGNKTELVQKWINRYDGKYFCLVLCLCNPGWRTVTTKKSVLLIPDNIISVLRV